MQPLIINQIRPNYIALNIDQVLFIFSWRHGHTDIHHLSWKVGTIQCRIMEQDLCPKFHIIINQIRPNYIALNIHIRFSLYFQLEAQTHRNSPSIMESRNYIVQNDRTRLCPKFHIILLTSSTRKHKTTLKHIKVALFHTSIRPC